MHKKLNLRRPMGKKIEEKASSGLNKGSTAASLEIEHFVLEIHGQGPRKEGGRGQKCEKAFPTCKFGSSRKDQVLGEEDVEFPLSGSLDSGDSS